MVEHGHIPHPGVGPSINTDEVKYHAYYQWVPFVLTIQAVMFYIPHYIWKKAEGEDFNRKIIRVPLDV